MYVRGNVNTSICYFFVQLKKTLLYYPPSTPPSTPRTKRHLMCNDKKFCFEIRHIYAHHAPKPYKEPPGTTTAVVSTDNNTPNAKKQNGGGGTYTPGIGAEVDEI